MPQTIKLKRGTGSGAPATSDLVEGELAYAEDRSNNGASAKLYISSINSSSAEVIDTVGGKYYTSIVDAATNANTASTVVKRDGSGNFSAGTITANLTGNASGTSGSTTGNAATATALATARTIHGVSFDGTANIDLSEVVADTVGAMFSSNTETGITATYQDANNTVDLVVGTLNQDTTGNAATATALATGRTIAMTGDGTWASASFTGSGNVTGAMTLATVNSNVGQFGAGTAIPVVTVNAKGLVTAVSTTAVSAASVDDATALAIALG